MHHSQIQKFPEQPEPDGNRHHVDDIAHANPGRLGRPRAVTGFPAVARVPSSGLSFRTAGPEKPNMRFLHELLATDERRALEFFVVGLRDVAGPAVDGRELLYNASVLAHYTLVSTQATHDTPAPKTLADVFDGFVINTSLHRDGPMMETAGAHCLLLAGFFEGQMRRRHNIRWYAALGADFFNRAAAQEVSEPKARLLHALARDFEPWRRRHARLGRELRDQAYLLTPVRPPM